MATLLLSCGIMAQIRSTDAKVLKSIKDSSGLKNLKTTLMTKPPNQKIKDSARKTSTPSATTPVVTAPATTTPVVTENLPDIIISALSTSYSPGQVTINYTITNIGKVGVKRGLLFVEGAIIGIGSGCGTMVVTAPVSEKERLLNPGETVSGSFSCSKSLTAGQNFKYRLNVSMLQNVKESNTANNSSEASFTAQ